MSAKSGMAALGVMMVLTGCDNMANQPKLNPYELPYDSPTRWPITPPQHIVARDEALRPPSAPPLTMALLKHGKQRFEIYCAPCHGRLGDGNGMIAQRGFPHPPSYYSDALRSAQDQHFYDVITQGYGVMFSYADRVEPEDRWAIVAYIRALQASTQASLSDVPPDKRSALQ